MRWITAYRRFMSADSDAASSTVEAGAAGRMASRTPSTTAVVMVFVSITGAGAVTGFGFIGGVAAGAVGVVATGTGGAAGAGGVFGSGAGGAGFFFPSPMLSRAVSNLEAARFGGGVGLAGAAGAAGAGGVTGGITGGAAGAGGVATVLIFRLVWCLVLQLQW